jgi:hypothetical protein
MAFGYMGDLQRYRCELACPDDGASDGGTRSPSVLGGPTPAAAAAAAAAAAVHPASFPLLHVFFPDHAVTMDTTSSVFRAWAAAAHYQMAALVDGGATGRTHNQLALLAAATAEISPAEISPVDGLAPDLASASSGRSTWSSLTAVYHWLRATLAPRPYAGAADNLGAALAAAARTARIVQLLLKGEPKRVVAFQKAVRAAAATPVVAVRAPMTMPTTAATSVVKAETLSWAAVWAATAPPPSEVVVRTPAYFCKQLVSGLAPRERQQVWAALLALDPAPAVVDGAGAGATGGEISALLPAPDAAAALRLVAVVASLHSRVDLDHLDTHLGPVVVDWQRRFRLPLAAVTRAQRAPARGEISGARANGEISGDAAVLAGHVGRARHWLRHEGVHHAALLILLLRHNLAPTSDGASAAVTAASGSVLLLHNVHLLAAYFSLALDALRQPLRLRWFVTAVDEFSAPVAAPTAAAAAGGGAEFSADDSAVSAAVVDFATTLCQTAALFRLLAR